MMTWGASNLILGCVILLSMCGSTYSFMARRYHPSTRLSKLNNPQPKLFSTVEDQTEQAGLSSEEDEALIQRIADEVLAESGVDLDQLINPSKVVNLERDIFQLNKQVESCTDSTELAELEATIAKKQATLSVEKRAVMKNWLKNLFVGQSVLAGIASLGMVYNNIPNYDAPLAIQALGFWMWWLFIIPSLRAR